MDKRIVYKFINAIKNENFPEMASICSNEDNLKIISPETSKLFNFAFKKNNIKIVKWFLTFKPSFNIEIDQNLLYSQYQNNKFEIIKIYLEYNPKCDISIILKQSLCQGNIEFSNYLLQINPQFEIDSTIIKKICEKNHVEMLDYLFNKNNQLSKDIKIYKSIDNIEILKVFIKYNPEFLKQIIEKENLIHQEERLEMIEEYNLSTEIHEIRTNFFIEQCRTNNFEIAKYIYEIYPDVIKFNWAFIWTCENGHIEIAKWLFEKRQESNVEYPIKIWEKAFIWSCNYGKLDVIKWIYSIKPDININANEGDDDDDDHGDSDINGFTMACLRDKLDVAKWLLEIDSVKTLSGIDTFNTFAFVCKYKKFHNKYDNTHFDPLPILKWLLEIKPDINISANNEQAFYNACYNGSLEIAKWLLEIKPDINISIDNDYIFRNSCNGIYTNESTIKWLLEIKPDINIEANNHEAFKNACEYDAIKIIRILISLNPTKYYIKISDHGNIISWKIKINYIRKETIKLKEEDIIDCPICLSKKSQVITNCKHQYCFNCIKKVNEKEYKCPMCRCEITDLFRIV